MKGGALKMVLLIILTLTLLILLGLLIGAVSVGGAVFIVIFGDVIVCMLVIVWFIKRLIKNRKRKC